MKARRDLWNGATATKRCVNRREKIVHLLTTLTPHRDYLAIFNFAHSVLNLANFQSSVGNEPLAKDYQAKLERALKKIAVGSFDRQLSPSELSLSEDNSTNTKPTADDVATKDT